MADKPLRFALSRGQFHDLHVASEKRVKIDREALGKLVLDHSAAIRRLHDLGVETIDAPEPEPDFTVRDDDE